MIHNLREEIEKKRVKEEKEKLKKLELEKKYIIDMLVFYEKRLKQIEHSIEVQKKVLS